tara:strand:- start:2487 stop:2594 length:108 start_codon:yes stop_codon:yes gene_type:complete
MLVTTEALERTQSYDSMKKIAIDSAPNVITGKVGI